jgi:flavin-binding protein dodecin
MLVSVTAAICVNLNQASKADSKIVSAEVCNTELACLQTLVEFHQVSLDEALKLYQQHLTRVPFLDHQKPPAPTPNWG